MYFLADIAGRMGVANIKQTGLWLAPVVSGLLWIAFTPEFQEQAAAKMAVIAVLMAILWITEALPLGVTALLPLVLYPFLGLGSTRAIAEAYVNSTIFLFLGGFLIALAIQRWSLHRRIAILMILRIGSSPGRLVIAFMLATAFLSMWISNTATTLMMLPIALSVISSLESRQGGEGMRRFSITMMLGIAYSASLGGMATLVGTPPNLVLARVYSISFPDQPPLSFAGWLFFALPLVIVLWCIFAWLLTRSVPEEKTDISSQEIQREVQQLGEMTYEEKWVAFFFVMTALLWITRSPIDIGVMVIPGWSGFLPHAEMIDDATVAIAVAVLMFFVKTRSQAHHRLLDASIFLQIPWQIILLFGGGFALAQGFVDTGLSALLGEKFHYLSGLPVWLIMLSVVLFMTFLTELTSNTATTQLMLPVFVSVSAGLDVPAMLLLVPVTLAASCAFMMPVATPPNAIVFGSNRLQIVDMAKAGLKLNIISAIVIVLYCYWIIPIWHG